VRENGEPINPTKLTHIGARRWYADRF